MKKLITIILLLSVIACSGQEKKISELPEITTVAASAEFPLSQGGTTYKATKANLQKEIADSLANHLLRIVALEENDSTWAQIRVDSIWNATPGVGVTIEGVKIEDYVVNIPAGTGKFEFGDGSSYITLPVDDVLHFFIGDETRWSLSTTNFNLTVPITPSPDKAVDFGGVGDFFRDAYFNRWYVANTSTFIDTLGTKLRLSDGSGTYLLEELAAGTSYSAGSGLTLTSTTFSLGGALSGQSLITGTGAANDILLRHINTGNYSQHLAIEGDSAIELIVFEDDDFTGYESGLFVSEGIVTLQARASISPQTIILTGTEMLVTDGANSIGLVGASYYGALASDNTYVQKKYVDDLSGLAGINAQIGTSYTPDLADLKYLITLDNASDITFTVPPFSSEAFNITDQIHLVGLGDGQVTVVEGSGVAIISADDALKLRVTGSTATLTNIDEDLWLLVGDITL